MSQSLYRKWRPQAWQEIIGQHHITQTLQNEIRAERISHAYLFAGPRGTGKTSTARILAKAVNCLDAEKTSRPCNQCDHCLAINQGRYLDLIEIDAASNTSVEDVRDLREKINFSPNHGKYKVYIIDEVHMLSTAAFNALLKTLEEPPAHAIFVLATTEAHKIPATVLSRCQRHEFRRLPVVETVDQLQRISEAEKIQIEEQAIYLIARQATGSMRDAISLLDQLASTDQVITVEFAQNVLGTVASQSVMELVDVLIEKDAGRGLDIIQRTLDAGSDPRLYSRQIVDYLRNMMLTTMGSSEQVDTTFEIREKLIAQAHFFSQEKLIKIIQIFNQSTLEIRSAWLPSLPLEMALLESMNVVANADNLAFTPPSDAAQNKEEEFRKNIVQTFNTNKTSETFNSEKSLDTEALNFRMIGDHWRIFLDEVGKQSKQTQALLNSCKPIGVKGLHVYLGFNGDFAKSKMEQKENLEMAEEILSQIFATKITIRCFVVNNQQTNIPPEVDSNGMVAAVLRDLGGEIVDIH